MFRSLMTIIRELYLYLTKLTFMLKHSVKFRRFMCVLLCLVCIVANCLVCIVVVILCVLLSSYAYLLYYVCIAVLTLGAGLLARSHYTEGSATGHLDTGFSWFPCIYKQMLK